MQEVWVTMNGSKVKRVLVGGRWINTQVIPLR